MLKAGNQRMRPMKYLFTGEWHMGHLFSSSTAAGDSHCRWPTDQFFKNPKQEGIHVEADQLTTGWV